MKIVENIENILNVGITIGNFDGVHRGHVSVLETIKEDCHRRSLAFCVVTFMPHPHQILAPQDNFLINTYLERRELLACLGIDYLYEIEFTRDLSTQGPEDFLNAHFIKNRENIKAIYAGYDFAFGADKEGGHEFLRSYCEKRKIEYSLCSKFLLDGKSVSSSIIRESIKRGDLVSASNLLGRNFFITGMVVRGEGRGKELGFPTINIKYSKQVVIPRAGVYATMLCHDKKMYPAITNVGDNPTFGSGRKTTIETNILDFDEMIYGDEVRVYFVEKIREEKKFAGAEELRLQIARDIEKAIRIHEK